MKKGISAVIATLLMLVITVALSITAYGFISGIFDQTTREVFTADGGGNTVLIRNDGTTSIGLRNLTVTIDGQPAPYTITPAMEGLISHWSFDEPGPVSLGSVAKDSMGNVNFGIYNLVSSVPGFHGRALRIDSTAATGCTNQNAGIHIPQASIPSNIRLLPQGDFTVSWWSNQASNSGQSKMTIRTNITIFPGNPSIWIKNGGSTNGTIAGGTNPAGGTVTSGSWFNYNPGNIPLNRWNHMVYIYDKTNLVHKLYVNGTLLSTTSWLSSSASATPVPLQNHNYGVIQWLSVGSYAPTCVDAIPNAAYDEVMIFGKALSDAEIQQLYSGVIDVGDSAIVTNATPLAPGFHKMKICSRGMCNTVDIEG